MNKAGRKSARKHTPAYLISLWLACLGSLGLLYLSGLALASNVRAFQSCDNNTSGLSVQSCGKSSADIGDLIILGLFVLCSGLVASLFTIAWRTTRGAQS